MIYTIKFIYKTFLLPPGILIFLLILYSFYLYGIKNRAYRGTALFTLLLYLCSIPLVGESAVNKLETKYAFPGNLKGDVIVMLGGGANIDTPALNGNGNLSASASSRLLACTELYNQLHVPIILSGGQVYSFTGNEAEIGRRMLINLGVKENDIIIENKSLNTEQNAENTAKILKDKGFAEPILVTSAFHMQRAVLLFERNKIQVVPYPCDYKTNIHKIVTSDDFIPNSEALSNLSTALKESIGILQISIFNEDD